jgi:hypothetical protein
MTLHSIEVMSPLPNRDILPLSDWKVMEGAKARILKYSHKLKTLE